MHTHIQIIKIMQMNLTKNMNIKVMPKKYKTDIEKMNTNFGQ